MWALREALLPGGSVTDVVVDGDRIARIGPGVAAGVSPALDCSGKLLLPAFIDGHIHLDKVLIRDELREHDGTLGGAIGAIHERKRRYTLADVSERARAVIGPRSHPARPGCVPTSTWTRSAAFSHLKA